MESRIWEVALTIKFTPTQERERPVPICYIILCACVCMCVSMRGYLRTILFKKEKRPPEESIYALMNNFFFKRWSSFGNKVLFLLFFKIKLTQSTSLNEMRSPELIIK